MHLYNFIGFTSLVLLARSSKNKTIEFLTCYDLNSHKFATYEK